MLFALHNFTNNAVHDYLSVISSIMSCSSQTHYDAYHRSCTVGTVCFSDFKFFTVSGTGISSHRQVVLCQCWSRVLVEMGGS